MWYLALVHLFNTGDCAYIQEDKDQFPNGYTVRKIVDVGESQYIYVFKTQTDYKIKFSHRDIKEFDKEEIKMKCPRWFQ